MFELEDYSSGFHDGFLNKYADSAGPTLDFYITDSLQDMMDIDLRTEIANVVGGTNELASLVNDLPSSLDHALEAISAINNNNNFSSSSSSHNTFSNSALSSRNSLLANSALHASPTSKWMGTSSSGLSWSSDYYADVGACVNPISVMPLISSSLHHSPKTNLNSASPPPASPNAERDLPKSHLTFSPAQMKVSAGSMRHEQIHSHIPKQIVTISSSVTAGTTAPATMATNSALQRKNLSAVDAIKKDLGSELRKVGTGNADDSKKIGLLSGNTGTNTIKLAPGIGGLTFANSITYNKLKQQSASKSAQGAPVTSNGTIVLKRDRDSSPLHNMATLNTNGNGLKTKLLGRNIVQATNSYTPKSIASSAHSPHLQHNGGASSPSLGSPASASSTSSANSSPFNGSFTAGLSSIHNNNSISTVNSIAVKPLQQKIKATPIESEFPKPAYSYSCLIAMALKNSRSGSLPVSEIYSFMCEHFPYFKTAPSGWKNSVRHNLSLNKCFEKIEKPATNGSQRKGCLWAMNPERIAKMDEEVQKWSRKDLMGIRNAMVFPEHLEALERGEMKHGSGDSDVELDSQSEIEETSDLEEQELDETIVDNMFVEEDIIDDDELLHTSMGGHMNHDDGGGNVVVINGALDDSAADHSNASSSNGGGGGIIEHEMHSQKHRDFDIEVEDIYDAIDIEDDKEAVRMAISQSDIIELSPADLNANVHHHNNLHNQQQHSSNGYQSPKRARLNINYSIAGNAGELEKQLLQQQQHQTIKRIKVQPQQLQQMQQQLQQQQPNVVVQTISNNGTRTTLQAAPQHLQQINAIANHHHNRRKMQLVSRIV